MNITLISSLLANFWRAKGKLKWHWQIQFPFAKYYYLLLMLIQSLASLHSYKFIKVVPLQNPQLNGAVKTLLKEVHPSIKGFNSRMSSKNCIYIYVVSIYVFCTQPILPFQLPCKNPWIATHYCGTQFTSSDWYAARLEDKYSYVYA